MLEMPNLKPRVFDALKGITENVSDQYPFGEWEFPVVIFADESSIPEVFTPEGERMTRIRFRVEIHAGDGSTTGIMKQVDLNMTQIGFTRTANQELTDMAGRNMRTMRYETIYDNKNNKTYHAR